MEVEPIVMKYGECRCCLNKDYLRDIMKNHCYNDQREVYYDMFIKCFSLFLSTDNQLSTLICSNCVTRLKDAYNFRKLVEESEQKISKALINSEQSVTKQETEDIIDEESQVVTDDSDMDCDGASDDGQDDSKLNYANSVCYSENSTLQVEPSFVYDLTESSDVSPTPEMETSSSQCLSHRESLAKPCESRSLVNVDSELLKRELIKSLDIEDSEETWNGEENCVQSTCSDSTSLSKLHSEIDKILAETMLSPMGRHNISLIAKTDPLICTLASIKLECNEEEHNLPKKLIELAKFVIEFKKINDSVTDLTSVLKSTNYTAIVKVIRSICDYDPKNGKIRNFSLALILACTIKECCETAIKSALQNPSCHPEDNTEKTAADLQLLKQLINAKWNVECKSLSPSTFNGVQKTGWNKLPIIPLSKDIKILDAYLCAKLKEAANELKEGSNSVRTYKQLLETIFCKVLLTNLRTPAELETLKVDEYFESGDNVLDKYKDIDGATSTLMKNKKISIKLENGRKLPVIFSHDVQQHIKLLLSVRNKFCSESNNFLFGNPYSEKSLFGLQVFENYATLSGVKHPKLISSTKIRNRVAIMSKMTNIPKIRSKRGIVTKKS